MSAVLLRGLVGRQGRPVSDAVVELHNAGGDVLTQVQVDAEGRFVFHVTPGRWSLHAWDRRGHRGRADVTVDEGVGTPAYIDLA